MFSALKHINCDLKMQFLCNLTSIIRKLNLRTKSPKFICKFTTIFFSVYDHKQKRFFLHRVAQNIIGIANRRCYLHGRDSC